MSGELTRESYPPARRRTWPHCEHCRDHQTPFDGSETLTDDGAGHTEPCRQCQGGGVTFGDARGQGEQWDGHWQSL